MMMYTPRHKAQPVRQLGGARNYFATLGAFLAFVLVLGGLIFA